MTRSASTRIDDYALIGDGRSVALVSRFGSIDWLCWPRFDSLPIFAGLLDPRVGGAWRIAPRGPARITRAYVDLTNVLETRFETPEGRIVLTDLMTIASEDAKARTLVPDHHLVRRLVCEAGEVEVDVHVEPRPGFGLRLARIEHHDRLGIRWDLGKALLSLRSDAHLKLGDDGIARASLRLRAGDAVSFSLTFDEEGPAVLPVLGSATLDAIQRSIAWWRAWVSRARYDGPYRDAVRRSVLALKLMSFAPSGAIIAAPTTSLPEQEGGQLNWDYRFCWVRDASFTARVLLDLGYTEDAEAFCSWMLHTTRLTRPELRVMYDVYGNDPGHELEVTGFAGYHGSQPVRVGNLAFDQLQLDTYGEVIDATAQLVRITKSLDKETRLLLRDYGEYVCAHWSQPDAGIWEPRDQLRHRTHSRLTCWVAIDRLLELQRHGLLGRVDAARYAANRAAIRDDIETHAFDRERQCYTAELGASELDASILLMSWYGFHPGSSPRMRSTYAHIRDRLGAGRGLFYRYEESLRNREGAFWICSFWAVEHLARGGGTLDDAHVLFDAARSYANDLGLMAEEIDPRTGGQLGNFPQAYTHVGLISAALSLERLEREIGERPIRTGRERPPNMDVPK